MTENNTGQSRSSQHRHTKKKSSSPSNKKKILKKVLIGLGAFNAKNIMIVSTKEFTTSVKNEAPNAQHLFVESLITTPEYINMVKRMNK